MLDSLHLLFAILNRGGHPLRILPISPDFQGLGCLHGLTDRLMILYIGLAGSRRVNTLLGLQSRSWLREEVISDSLITRTRRIFTPCCCRVLLLFERDLFRKCCTLSGLVDNTTQSLLVHMLRRQVSLSLILEDALRNGLGLV